jgi:hypothetical protein
LKVKLIRGTLAAPLCFLFVALMVANSRAMHFAALAHADDADDPWSSSQTVQPADLVKELAAPAHPDEPAVVCVGFRPLY